jgi:ATP-dependent RNA/DNA helicase IGHMBP2
VTYERIRTGLETLENHDIPEDSLTLVRTLFGIREPTFQNEFVSDEEKQKFSFDFFNQNLNLSQKEAVKFSLEANELALIHGPPGTGKTTTISELILQGVSQGMKILVVAPSNIAVDNIAEKLIPFRKALNFDMCRIGHPARVMESIHEIALDTKVEKSSNTKFVKDIKREIEKKRKELSKTDKFKKEERRNLKSELRSLREDIKGSYRTTVIDIYSKCKIILATCIGAADPYLKESLNKYNSGTFDLVVIDECAQATEALCWLSILLGKKLVLAGDHLQLPPTIKSKEAEKGLSFTLFDRMIKQFGDKCCKLLDIQYRMNEKIMNFSSKELYEGKLHAHDSVKSHKVIDMLHKEVSENSESQPSSIDDRIGILDQNLLLLNTNGFEFYESVDIDSTSRFNIGEAKICKFLIDYLKSQNIDYNNIGIITPYSAQVNTLRSLFPVDEYKELEVSTVDGFQGREKEIIILSLVRSNKRREVGFLADSRRLNVAITRAKRMVALICDSGTVSNHPFMKKMVDYFDKEAYDVGLLENIFDFRDIEDIKYECMKNSEKEKEHTKELQKKEKDCKFVPVNGQNQSQAKKNKNKKNKKDSEKSEKNDNNLQLQESNIYNEIPPQGREKSNSVSLTFQHKHPHKKEDVNLEFINKIKLLIEDFIESKEDEYKIEGLSNSERRYIHYYAEIKHLIHESQGEGENRVMILRKHSKSKKSPEKRKSAEKNEVKEKEIITHQKIENNSSSKTQDQVQGKIVQVENISVTTEKKILGTNKIEKNKGGVMVNPEVMNKNKQVKTVTANHKIKTENVSKINIVI